MSQSRIEVRRAGDGVHYDEACGTFEVRYEIIRGRSQKGRCSREIAHNGFLVARIGAPVALF